jgi:hypothetical protein
MTVEQTDVVDGIGTTTDGKEAVLLISDHLAWDRPDHIEKLSAKIEAYANVILNGGLKDLVPDAANKVGAIQVVYEHPPSKLGCEFLVLVEKQLADIGIKLRHGILPAGY